MFGSHKKVQVVMLRGLIHPWKEVVFFDFDQTTPYETHQER